MAFQTQKNEFFEFFSRKLPTWLSDPKSKKTNFVSESGTVWSGRSAAYSHIRLLFQQQNWKNNSPPNKNYTVVVPVNEIAEKHKSKKDLSLQPKKWLANFIFCKKIFFKGKHLDKDFRRLLFRKFAGNYMLLERLACCTEPKVRHLEDRDHSWSEKSWWETLWVELQFAFFGKFFCCVKKKKEKNPVQLLCRFMKSCRVHAIEHKDHNLGSFEMVPPKGPQSFCPTHILKATLSPRTVHANKKYKVPKKWISSAQQAQLGHANHASEECLQQQSRFAAIEVLLEKTRSTAEVVWVLRIKRKNQVTCLPTWLESNDQDFDELWFWVSLVWDDQTISKLNWKRRLQVVLFEKKVFEKRKDSADHVVCVFVFFLQGRQRTYNKSSAHTRTRRLSPALTHPYY